MTTIAFSPAVLAKARRLIADGALTRAPASEFYVVAGDHGHYPIPVSSDRRNAYCPCPASSATCSHAAAVLLAIAEEIDVPAYEVEDDSNPFDGLVEPAVFDREGDR